MSRTMSAALWLLTIIITLLAVAAINDLMTEVSKLAP